MGGALDGVLLNAGIVHPPKHRETTVDGHEVVFATNVLGHFALAGELLTTLAAARGRMVWVGSMSTSLTPYDPVDPQLTTGYSGWRAYVQSKVATTALGFEADRRLRDAGVAVDERRGAPGLLDERTHARASSGSTAPSKLTRFTDNLQAPITQSKEHGAWSLVRALVDPDDRGRRVLGPEGRPAGRAATAHGGEDHARPRGRRAAVARVRGRDRSALADREGRARPALRCGRRSATDAADRDPDAACRDRVS